MDHKHLLRQIEDYVLAFYKEHDTTKLTFHNLQHTQNVVLAATRIAKHYVLDDKDQFIVLAAVWFHDLGYLINISNHEEEGAALAEAFLSEHKTGHGTIKAVKGCILATKMPQSPQNQLEEIVCDADLFHLGTKDFFNEDSLLFQEKNLLNDAQISKLDWWGKTIGFLEKQTYHTDYCQRQLTVTLEKNIDKLKKKMAKEEKEMMEADGSAESVPGKEGKPKEGKADRSNIPDKGIETMFRISSSNHQRLSDMADKKAHIMITVNSIILSAVISLVLRRLDQYGYLIIPTFILLTISLLAMTFSILSTRPSIPNGTFSQAELDERRVNLLFFGNFYKMPLEAFNEGMEIMMEDKKFLYHSLIKDLYSQGVVLGKKYHLLRIAYSIFMYGLIVAVVAFIIASAFFRK
jgi:hypothetical protein